NKILELALSFYFYITFFLFIFFFFSSRRRHTRFSRDWSSDVCSSDLGPVLIKIMGHLFYGILDPGQIGPVMGNNIADSLMFFRSGELGIFTRTDPFDRTVYRYRILNPI